MVIIIFMSYGRKKFKNLSLYLCNTGSAKCEIFWINIYQNLYGSSITHRAIWLSCTTYGGFKLIDNTTKIILFCFTYFLFVQHGVLLRVYIIVFTCCTQKRTFWKSSFGLRLHKVNWMNMQYRWTNMGQKLK